MQRAVVHQVSLVPKVFVIRQKHASRDLHRKAAAYGQEDTNAVIVGRRASLVLSALAAIQVQQSLALENKILASPGDDLLHIINQAPPGSVICLQEGEYLIDTTLEIQKPLTVRGSTKTIVSLSTETPYHPVFHVSSTSGVTLEDMTIRHRSPSVANNYAIYVQNAGDCTIRNMDISSSTGTGVSIEGIQQGTIRIQDCTIHDCAKNGMGIFPSIEDTTSSETEISIQNTHIEHNQGHGIVVKGMHEDRVTILNDNEIHSNRLFGLQLSDSENVCFLKSQETQQAAQDVLSRNGSGAIRVEDSYSSLLSIE